MSASTCSRTVSWSVRVRSVRATGAVHANGSAWQSTLREHTRLLVLSSHMHLLFACDRVVVLDRPEHARRTRAATAAGAVAMVGRPEEIASAFPTLFAKAEGDNSAAQPAAEALPTGSVPLARALSATHEQRGPSTKHASAILIEPEAVETGM
jgi:hypothetical protein